MVRRNHPHHTANPRSSRQREVNARLDLIRTASPSQALQQLNTPAAGLDEAAIQSHRSQYGTNQVTPEGKKSLAKRIFEAFVNPFTAILSVLALVSTITDLLIPLYQGTPEEISPLTVLIIVTMVLSSGALRLLQESRSGHAAEKLLAMITTTCTVLRQEGGKQEIPLHELVVGDLVFLSAGDMIPGDLRILEAKDLFLSQSSLTGESDPVEKTSECCPKPYETLTDCPNLAFLGSNVISGSATALVVSVGDDTLFGGMASALHGPPVETSFTKGVNAVSWVLIRFMLIMVPIVFFLNGMTKGNWVSAFLFAISIAVGLTPEMLPMIVTTCLAKGAVSMSRKKTIVKNLNSIQNLGAMDILCTDKTGTLTQDRVVLEYHLNLSGQEDPRVLRHAYLNSYFQTGYKNLMDLAIIQRTEEEALHHPVLANLSSSYIKVDEIPFDFSRRRLSTVVEDSNGKRQMITKGAVEEMLSICSHMDQQDQGVQPLTQQLRQELLHRVDRLNEQGMRVIAIAQKTNPSPVGSFGVDDERDMVLLGYLAFLDPPKESAAQAIRTLQEHGVTTKILTGDNERVTRCVCKQVGLPVNQLLLGSHVEAMDDLQLAEAARDTNVFAKLSPEQKSRVVAALRSLGYTVGFMGDGINDAAAMKSADVGISVDTAVDVAKESADLILLEKSLMVLEDGIMEGRKTYANMIKYIKMTASSNFGNMFSVLIASVLLPFLPMESIHLILLNLIYDLCCTAIPWDHVDEEFLTKPRTWDASGIGSFMVWIGPISSVFDWLTYAFLYFVLCPMVASQGVLYHQLASQLSGAQLLSAQTLYIALFQTGWFVQSMWSQTLVIHMIRTPKIPFLQSRASTSLTLVTLVGMVGLTLIPYTPFGALIGLVPLPSFYFLYLLPCILLYMLFATVVKRLYLRRYGELL